MRRRYEGCLLLGLLAVAAVCNVAVASLVNQVAGLRVLFPEVASKSINMSMADFGMPKYGGSLSGELIYISSDEIPYYNDKVYNCFPRDCQYACDLNQSKPLFSIAKQPGTTAYIMLVDRGPIDDPCYFLDKVYQAQMAGADAVLVADDKDEEPTTAIAPDTDDTREERLKLNISAAMISRADADYLKLYLRHGGQVTVELNWAASFPQSDKVTWEYWTSTADVCGPVCEERVNFTKAVRLTAAQFEEANVASFTPYYFLQDCKEGTLNTTICKDNCFSNGRYCARPSLNYTGQEILKMNIRAKCFWKQVSALGRGYIWWDYTTRMFDSCSMATAQYTPECAQKVFNSLSAIYDIGTPAAWEKCAQLPMDVNNTIAILEEDLMAQFGNYTNPPMAPVIIIPTIRINRNQYRGSLQAGSVMRAMCAAFTTGTEPDVCNQRWISDDECQPPLGEGYLKCSVAESGNRSRCVNTFQGYNCVCESGFQSVRKADGSEACEDINECSATTVPYKDPKCSCPRCGCINHPGYYNCTGERQDKCTAEFNYNGCWAKAFVLPDGSKKTLTTCEDRISEYLAKSIKGTLTDADVWYGCGDCPPCFDKRPDGECVLRCADLTLCDDRYGYCKSQGADQGSSGGGGQGGGGQGGGGSGGGQGGSSNSKGGGVHPGFVILVVLATAALTGFVVMGANHILMRRRMGEEIRDIMASYMPLQEERTRNTAIGSGRGGGGGGGFKERIIRSDEDSDEEGRVGPYGWSSGLPTAAGGGGGSSAAAPALIGASQRAVWGPPAATTAAAAMAPKPAAAITAASRPTVEAFGGGGGAAAAAAAAATAEARLQAEDDADPLLGRQFTASGAPGGKMAGGGGGDNPFL